MRLAPQILAGVALAALVVAPATAGNLGQTYQANLDPLNAGSHTVAGTTYTIPTAD
ncbi:MAG TPA: hypothetical protein VM427_09960 [Patescibacteria group bacterium]|nr:hypothetical protein [Patescibacteria group bacterium]